MNDNTIFFQVTVIDNQDPMMLGRIRARLLTDDYSAIVKSITDPPWDEEKDAWETRDPFIFNPLMPYFMYQVPKVTEMAQVLYVNKDFKYQNQYYIQNTFSSPTTTGYEYYQGGNKFTGTGTQLKNPKPLKNKDGTYTDKAIHKGVFPEPGDNALLGRGSADVIVKQDEILIRAGKFKGSVLQPNVPPVANPQRGFLQLSRFNKSKKSLPNKIVSETNEIIVQVKYLIEWVITNPENTFDKFSGTVYLYKLKADLSTNSKNLTVGSEVKESLKSLVASETFSLLTKTESINFINNFIKTCNKSTKTKSGIQLFSSEQNKFPIFYRPNALTYSYLTPASPPNFQYNQNYSSYGEKFCFGGICNISLKVIDTATGQIVATSSDDGPEIDATKTYQSAINQITNKLLGLKIEDVILPEYTQLSGTIIFPPTSITSQQSIDSTNNISEIFNQIKLYPALKNGGYGLIYSKGKVGKPLNIKTTIVPQETYLNDSSTYGALVSDTVYLLSQTSAIPGKGKINFDNTLYGVSLDQFTDEFLPKTSSLVRGEELIELLNLIVRFLTTHTHAYPGLPPTPVTQDGSNISDILTEMQNAYVKILNENIRLN
jgi:hypothetical protein